MERVFVDVEDARTIGRRLRLIRNSRKKGLRVIAGLAGMSKSKLSLIERGEIGQTYLIGADGERNNLEVVQTLLRLMGRPARGPAAPVPGEGPEPAPLAPA